jgi:hypothetical protein
MKRRPLHAPPKRAGTREDIAFYGSLSKWRAAVKASYPGARIKKEADGVHRAYARRVGKVGVFGRLAGHGYVSGLCVAKSLHGQQRQAVADAYA